MNEVCTKLSAVSLLKVSSSFQEHMCHLTQNLQPLMSLTWTTSNWLKLILVLFNRSQIMSLTNINWLQQFVRALFKTPFPMLCQDYATTTHF